MLEAYRKHVTERQSENLPPLALSAEQVADLIELIKNPPAGEAEFLVELLVNRVPPGVDQAAYVKAAFLADVAKGNVACELISQVRATELLGTMLGGYNIQPLMQRPPPYRILCLSMMLFMISQIKRPIMNTPLA